MSRSTVHTYSHSYGMWTATYVRMSRLRQKNLPVDFPGNRLLGHIRTYVHTYVRTCVCMCGGASRDKSCHSRVSMYVCMYVRRA